MAIFNNNYSALITKGLGTSACCALITVGFGVLGSCRIDVRPPVEGGGIPVRPTWRGPTTPYVKAPKYVLSAVHITIEMKSGNKWEKSYAVSQRTLDLFVQASNVVKQTKIATINSVTTGARIVGDIKTRVGPSISKVTARVSKRTKGNNNG